MAEQRDSLYGAPEEKPPGVTLSESLIVTRRRCSGLQPSSTLRLDRENIASIGRVQGLAGVQSVYLQQNQIQKIENLESFPNLRFLCLARNRIQRVENLRALPQLSALDLSHNLIQVLDTEELPRSLRILDLKGNECTHQGGYRDQVLAALPHLLQLDSRPVHANTAGREAARTGRGPSSSDDDEGEELFQEPSAPFTADKDLFVDLPRELAGRARQRRRRSLEEHRERLLELLQRRAELHPPGHAGIAAALRARLQPRGTALSPLPAPGGAQGAPGAALPPPGVAEEREGPAEGERGGEMSHTGGSSWE